MNKQYFDLTTTNGKKHFQNLLNTLIEYNTDSENHSYNDIHVKQEENFVIIEWEMVPYDHEWGGEFKFIEEDDVVMKEVYFPDGHYEYILPDEVEDTLKQWHEKNPDWQKNEWGMWTNVEENRQYFIQSMIEDWIMRKVKEDDSSFAEKTTYYKEINSVEDLFSQVPPDVKQRTGYIIMNYDLASKLYPEKVPSSYYDMKGIIKLDTVDDDYHIYTTHSQHIFPSILFVTDTDYLIYRLNMEHERKAG